VHLSLHVLSHDFAFPAQDWCFPSPHFWVPFPWQWPQLLSHLPSPLLSMNLPQHPVTAVFPASADFAVAVGFTVEATFESFCEADEVAFCENPWTATKDTAASNMMIFFIVRFWVYCFKDCYTH